MTNATASPAALRAAADLIETLTHEQIAHRQVDRDFRVRRADMLQRVRAAVGPSLALTLLSQANLIQPHSHKDDWKIPEWRRYGAESAELGIPLDEATAGLRSWRLATVTDAYTEYRKLIDHA